MAKRLSAERLGNLARVLDDLALVVEDCQADWDSPRLARTLHLVGQHVAEGLAEVEAALAESLTGLEMALEEEEEEEGGG